MLLGALLTLLAVAGRVAQAPSPWLLMSIVAASAAGLDAASVDVPSPKWRVPSDCRMGGHGQAAGFGAALGFGFATVIPSFGLVWVLALPVVAPGVAAWNWVVVGGAFAVGRVVPVACSAALAKVNRVDSARAERSTRAIPLFGRWLQCILLVALGLVLL